MNIEHAKRVLAHQQRQQNMLISSAFPSKYLKAADLSGEPTPVTMTIVKQEQVARNGDPQPVLYMKEFQQGMVLNKTNGKAIAKLFGDDTNNWRGQRIEIFEAMVEFQGDVVPAIRVRPIKTANINADKVTQKVTPELDSWDPTEPAGPPPALKAGEAASRAGIESFKSWRDALSKEEFDMVRPFLERLMATAKYSDSSAQSVNKPSISEEALKRVRKPKGDQPDV